MKIAAAILLFIMILLQTFSSFVIQAGYFLNKSYIAKELCINKDQPKLNCQGKCYLSKQLKEQEQQEQQSSNPKSEKFEILLFFVAQALSYAHIQDLSKIEYTDLQEKTLSAFPRSVFHPPSV